MKLPRDVNGSEAVRALIRLGFEEVRQGNRTVAVPQHKPIKPGTLKSLIEQAGVSLDAFLAEL